MKQSICRFLYLFLLVLSVLFTDNIHAQVIAANNAADPESAYSLEELIREVLIDGNCAEVEDIRTNLIDASTGNYIPNQNPGDIGAKSYGYFRRPDGINFPFREGIILSTGRAQNAGNNIIPGILGDVIGTGADPDLINATGNIQFDYNDAVYVEFSFIPQSDEISFRYLMASEEYDPFASFPCPQPDGTVYADSFAFLLRAEGENFNNIALIPNTGLPVSVENIQDNANCDSVNPEYYAGDEQSTPPIEDTNYEGRTVELIARATVTPGVRYTIKLVIADYIDPNYDSAVFLEAGSFNLGLDLGDDFVSASNSAVCGDEVTLTANIPANNYTWLKDGVVIPGANSQTYVANLGNGTYTCEISNSANCNDSDDIYLEFVEPGTINPNISDFQICDADGDLVALFDLTTKDAEILDGQDPADFLVEYYDGPDDTDIIPTPNTYINTSPTQTLRARVVNRASTNCFAEGTFIIEATSRPNTTRPSDYEICDNNDDGDDANGFIQSFLLSTKDNEILGSLDPTLYTVSYHLNAVDAESGANPINKLIPYTNVVVNQQAIYYRVENVDNQACYESADDNPITPPRPFNLIVSALPTINNNITLRQCDNDTDGFSAFNLFEASSDISANFMNETFVFYPTENDAINDTNAYTTAEATAYTNQTVTTDTVWARAISNFGCYRIAQVNLIVSTTGLPSTFQRSFTVCDDFLDLNGDDNANNDERDGVSAFDFSSVTQEVIDLFPASQQLTVTYYRNEADALSESDPITDPSNYRNIGYPNAQQIYIRVDSNLDNDCLGFGPFIDLTVDPVPTADDVNDLELCDNLDDGDGFNGLVQTFDLDSQTPTILGTQDPADFTVTYHTSFADAEAGANAITTTAMYTNIVANQQTIYVRVTDNSTGCFTNQTSFDLIVNQLPVANFVEDLEICDDDSDGSARNGFSQSFDLELQTAGILGAQDPTQFSVTYHASLSDAQAGILPLGSPFSNSIPYSQTIYVRVSNGDTGCANGVSTFNVIVNPEPIAAEVSNLSYCDDDMDGDDTNGFVQNIDLDSQIPGILDFDNTGQDEDDYTVTFHETQQDATDGTNALSSSYANTTANQQTIYVRIVNNDTGCVNDDFTFDIVVSPLPDFQVTTPQIVCLNGPELTLSIELPLAVYDYVWTDPSGNNLIGPQINITSGGLYTVTATTTDGTGCSRSREILVNESIIASITEDDVTIVDDSDNNSITIDTTNLGIGDYEFALTNENGIIIRSYQDDPLFENLEGGIYNILIRDKNGCGVATLTVSVIEFPKFFTPNNDGIKDTWVVKGANSFFYPESTVSIFNRFGKLVAQINIEEAGWDGTFNGNVLPSDDYWYAIRLVDRNGVVRERKGNFTLLRSQ